MNQEKFSVPERKRNFEFETQKISFTKKLFFSMYFPLFVRIRHISSLAVLIRHIGPNSSMEEIFFIEYLSQNDWKKSDLLD